MKTTTKTNAAHLDGAECPICSGWNCTPASPHLAWVKGTPQNALIVADRAAMAAFQAARAAKAVA